MSSLKPIKLWGAGGPNPPKVRVLLEELGLPYEIVAIPFSDVKKPEYLEVNPNGRVPAIYDPNTDLTLWESGAIIEYLVEKYDTEHKLSFEAGTKEYYLAKQWLYFQVSGQGPYFGQAAWFLKFHHEQLPSAVERYVKEINRVTGVIELHLSRQKTAGDGPWLVGDKVTFADLSFYQWFAIVTKFLTPEQYNLEDYALTKQWLDKIGARESEVKVAAAATQH